MFVFNHNIPRNYKQRLNHSIALLLFGFTQAQSDRLNNLTVTKTTNHQTITVIISENGEVIATIQKPNKKNDKPGTEVSKMLNAGTKWAVKGLQGYQPKGCLTDLANLALAMMQVNVKLANQKGPKQEKKVALWIRRFVSIVMPRYGFRHNRLNALWIPDTIIEDDEVDDGCCKAFLRKIHKLRRTNLTIMTQLPDDSEFDALAEKRSQHGNVFRDPDSRNARALRSAHFCT